MVLLAINTIPKHKILNHGNFLIPNPLLLQLLLQLAQLEPLIEGQIGIDGLANNKVNLGQLRMLGHLTFIIGMDRLLFAVVLFDQLVGVEGVGLEGSELAC